MAMHVVRDASEKSSDMIKQRGCRSSLKRIGRQYETARVYADEGLDHVGDLTKRGRVRRRKMLDMVNDHNHNDVAVPRLNDAQDDWTIG